MLVEQKNLQQSTLNISEHEPELELIEQQLIESQIQLDDFLAQQRSEHQQWQTIQLQHKELNDQIQ